MILKQISTGDYHYLKNSSHLEWRVGMSGHNFERDTGQMEPNLAGSIYVRSSIKLLHLVPFGQQTWPPRLILFSDWLMLKKSSPLKQLGQMESNLARSIYVRSKPGIDVINAIKIKISLLKINNKYL
jgi:hypothetical protein